MINPKRMNNTHINNSIVFSTYIQTIILQMYIMAVKDNIKRQCYFLCWLKDKFINFTKWNDFYLKKKLLLFRNRNIALNKFEPSFMSASITAYCWQVFSSLLHCCFKFMALQWKFLKNWWFLGKSQWLENPIERFNWKSSRNFCESFDFIAIDWTLH
jgi:hypothetical protein